MEFFEGGTPGFLPVGHATASSQRSGGERGDEAGVFLEEDGDGDGLVAVRLEGLQLVELEVAAQTMPAHHRALLTKGVMSEPGELA